MSAQKLTPQQRGGQVVAQKYAPLYPCPRCGKVYPVATSWMAWLGHLSLHKLADRYFGGDLAAAQKRLRENGIARQDPMPENGAFKPYRPIRQLSFPPAFFVTGSPPEVQHD